jgi:hypothetical protein
MCLDPGEVGNLYTFFLCSPPCAFLRILMLQKVSASAWTSVVDGFQVAEGMVESTMEKTIGSGRHMYILQLDKIETRVDETFHRFMGDDFAKRLLVRHILSRVVFSMHCAFQEPKVRMMMIIMIMCSLLN